MSQRYAQAEKGKLLPRYPDDSKVDNLLGNHGQQTKFKVYFKQCLKYHGKALKTVKIIKKKS